MPSSFYPSQVSVTKSTKPSTETKQQPRKVTKGEEKAVKDKAKAPQHAKHVPKNQVPKFNWKETEVFENPNADKDFFEKPGPARIFKDDFSPGQIFQVFFTDAIVSQICTETNRYYDQSHKQKNAKYTKWKPTTVTEIKAFIGVLIAMGITKLPEMRDYWRKNSLCYVSWFSTVFTRGRFEAILNVLHLVDNKQCTNNDKLYKLGNLHNKLNINFYKAYTPERNLAVDEQMIGTKCRVSCIQYMPAKPKKFGIKLWALCESSSGYCLQFKYIKAKSLTRQKKVLSHRVVMDLAQHYFHANYHIYMDNFYTSPDLFVALAAMDTYACGTIRKNRGQFPTNFKEGKLKRGESSYIQTDDLLAVHWFDKRDVFMLSTIHGTGSVEVQRRGDKESIQKPLMISKYNTYMGGVDLCDQLLSNYSMQRKSKK